MIVGSPLILNCKFVARHLGDVDVSQSILAAVSDRTAYSHMFVSGSLLT